MSKQIKPYLLSKNDKIFWSANRLYQGSYDRIREANEQKEYSTVIDSTYSPLKRNFLDMKSVYRKKNCSTLCLDTFESKRYSY